MRNTLPTRPTTSLLALLFIAGALACDDGVEPSPGDTGADATDAEIEDLAEDDASLPEIIAIETGSLSLRVTVDPFGFELRNAAGGLALRTLNAPFDLPSDPAEHAYGPPAATFTEAAFEERSSAGWDGYVGEDEPWIHFDETRSAQREDGLIDIRLGSSARADIELSITLAVEASWLRVELTLEGAGVTSFNRLGQSFERSADEHFFGLGGRFTTVDHTGQSYYCWVEESGLGLGEGYLPGPGNPYPNGEAMTGFPIPFVLSSAGYGLWVDTGARSQFHLGSHSSRLWRFEVADRHTSYSVFVNSDPLRTLADFTSRIGRPELPPAWAFGPRRRLDPGTMIDGVPEWQALREHGVPTTVIEDRRPFLPTGAHLGREEHIELQATTLHHWGFKLLGYTAPHVSAVDERVAGIYEEGARERYFVENDDGDPYLVEVYVDALEPVATLDVTSADAVEWYRDLIRDGIDLGYDGWRLDFGEAIPRDARFADGRSGWELHNPYPALFQATVQPVLHQALPNDHAMVVRSGYTESTALSPLVWAANSNASFGEADGLPSVVRAGINLGISGVPFYGSDIGGGQSFNDPAPDRELYLRWAAFGALSPLMHDENIGIGRSDAADRWNIWSDDDTLEIYASFARFHTRLVPYLHSMAQQAVLTGAPLMRHLFLVHPEDPETYALDDQYYLGSSLLVAPIVRRGDRARQVYFPEGSFVHWQSKEVIEGPRWVNVDVPLDDIPVFIADGGIVPLFDETIETVAPENHPEVVGPGDVAHLLDVRSALSQGQATLTMADGTTLHIEVTGEVAAPFVVAESDLPFVLTLDQVATCDGCYLLREGDPTTLWVTTPLAENITVTGSGIALTITNPPTRPRRARWEVILIRPPEQGSGSQ